MPTPKQLTLAAAAVLAAAAPSAARADVPGATVAAPYAGHELSQFDGTAAWSRQDADGFHLVVDRGSGPQDVPIAPQPRPWDVDLGGAKGGGVAAVVSLCASNSAGYEVRGSCDVSKLDLVSGRLTRVRLASTAKEDEVAPTTDDGTIAWGREAAGKATIRLAGAKATTAKVIDLGTLKPRSVDDLDLSAKGLAAAVEAPKGLTPGAEHVLFKPSNKAPRTVAEWGEGEEHAPGFSVSLASDALWIGAQNLDAFSDEHGLVARYDLAKRTVAGFDSGPLLTSVAADAGSTSPGALLTSTSKSDTPDGIDQITRFATPELGPLAGQWVRIFSPKAG